MKYERSSGAVVFNKHKFLLLKYGLGHWGLVKGNIEEGESKEETMMRELREETGIERAHLIDGFEEKVDYFYTFRGEKIHKFVTYFLIESEEVNVDLSFEHEEFIWLPYEVAIEKVDYEDTKKVLRKAKNFLDEYKKKQKKVQN
jgi:8-oxo-dGTP pyrophosphatase MutT (NUDIX family)